MKEIPRDRVVERLRVENPWWTPPHAIGATEAAYRPRVHLQALKTLIVDARVRRSVLLLGPRRVGKTVLLHHVVHGLLADGVPPTRICMLSVDHPLYNGMSLADLIDAYRTASGLPNLDDTFVFFDEIQYLRDWERHLKSLVDDHERTRFVASGSAAAALRRRSLESGAGRFTDFLLPPLSFYEYLSLLGLERMVGWHEGTGKATSADIPALNEHFVHYLNYGGYPEVALSRDIQMDPGRYLKADIIDKVLLRDLPSLYGIQDIQELNSLFTALAYNSAGEVSIDSLATRSGVAANTIRRYVQYLEAAFLVKVVPRVDRAGRRFQRATAFKIYLTNPSMRAALFSPVGADDEAAGDMAETAVFAQRLHDPAPVCYARWSHGEVDLVGLGANLEPEWAVEVKWSDRLVSRLVDLKALVAFCKANRLRGATVTTRTAITQAERDGIVIEFVPTALYCYAAGRAQVARPSPASPLP